MNGNVQHGWGLWTVVPGWFSFENAGGGIAVMQVDGKHKLITMLVDDPIGQNAGLYRVLDLDTDPATAGSWEDLPFDSEVLAVHAAVLPTGKVMFFAGSGNVKRAARQPGLRQHRQEDLHERGVGPDRHAHQHGDENFFHPVAIKGDDGKVFDFFCGGDSFLADGRLLSAGGTLAYPGHISGRADAVLFNPTTQQWARAGHMAHGRWYPTLVTLGDGRVLAASGLNEDGNLNDTIEVYSPQADTWQALHLPPHFPGLPLYAHLFLMADGRILFTGGQVEGPDVHLGPCLLDIAHGQVGVAFLQGLHEAGSRKQSASVLLPPAQDQKAMIIGGGVGDEGIIDATAAVDVIDLTAATPVFQAVGAHEPAPYARQRGAPPRPHRARHRRGPGEGEPAYPHPPVRDLRPGHQHLDLGRVLQDSPPLPFGGPAAARRTRRRRRRQSRAGYPRGMEQGPGQRGDAARHLQPALPLQGPPPRDHGCPRGMALRPGRRHLLAAGRRHPLGAASSGTA